MHRTQASHCTATDGTDLYYEVVGPETPTAPDLVLCDGIGCDGFVWKYVQTYFAPHHRILRWHYRGHGRSEAPRDPRRLEMADLVTDLFCVLDAAGMERPILAGHSVGVQVILEAHRLHPERVRALVPVCGSYGHPLDTFHDTPHLARTFPLLLQATALFQEQAVRLWRSLLPSKVAWWLALVAGEVNRSLIRFEDLEPYFAHLGQMDPAVFLRMLSHVAAHSAEDHLPAIDVPTLVVGAEEDTFTPVWLSRRMAEAIPGAELLVVPKGSHAAPIEQPDLVCLRMEKFFRERLGCYRDRSSSPSPPEGGLSVPSPASPADDRSVSPGASGPTAPLSAAV